MVVKVPDFVLVRRADSLFSIGEEFEKRRVRDSAIFYYDSALAIKEKITPNDTSLVRQYIATADIFLTDFKYDVADKYLEKARLIADETQLKPDVIVEIYFKSANCKENMSDSISANSLLQIAENIIKREFPNDRIKLSRVYYLLANNYYNSGNYPRAVDYLVKSIALTSKTEYKTLGTYFNSMALCYREQGVYEKAITYFNSAIVNILKWGQVDSDDLAKVYLQKAFALKEFGELDSALYFLKKNLSIRKKVHGEKSPNTFGAKFSLGEFYFNEKQFDSAAYYYQASLTSLISDFDDNDIKINPTPGPTEWNTDLIIGLVGKANALEKLFSINSTQVNLAETALQSYLLADSVFYAYKSNSLWEDSQLRQMEEEYIPYHKIVGLCERLNYFKKDERYINIALRVMESSRASLLQRNLAKTTKYNSAGLDPRVTKKERELNNVRSEIIQKLRAPGISAQEIDSLNLTLLSIDNNYNKWLLEIGRREPNYVLSRYNTSPITLLDCQSFLRKNNSILIEYLWSDEAIYAILLKSDQIKLDVIPRTQEFNHSIKTFLEELNTYADSLIKKNKFQRFSRSSLIVCKYLVGPFLSDFEFGSNLIISADGPLSTLPFEALIVDMPKSDEVDYRLPYLISNYTISYAYSTAILVEQSDHARVGDRLLAVGFAGNGPAGNSRNLLSDLPGTEAEIQSIKDVMKDGEYLLEYSASESAFKKRAPDFDILHIAVHGIADTINALESRLIFRSEADSIDDGQLFAHELYGIDLDGVDLVVLSACESGIGKHQVGEGAMSIARGFAYSGCPSLVTSLWKVNDRTTAYLMKKFYEYLSGGHSINLSLTKAKLDYLTESNEYNSHPTYWAPFLQVGDSRALDMERPNYLGWVLVLVFSIAAVVWGLYHRSFSL